MKDSDIKIDLPKIRLKETVWHHFFWLFGSRIINKTHLKVYVNNELIRSFKFSELVNKELSNDSVTIIDDVSCEKVFQEFIDSECFTSKIKLC